MKGFFRESFKKNFGEALKNLAVTFLKELFHDVHTVSKMLRELC